MFARHRKEPGIEGPLLATQAPAACRSGLGRNGIVNSDLIRLLDEAVPEPPRLLNARSVVIAATRRHRIRVSGLVIAVAAIGVIAVTASPAALGRNGQAATMRVTQVPLTISA